MIKKYSLNLLIMALFLFLGPMNVKAVSQIALGENLILFFNSLFTSSFVFLLLLSIIVGLLLDRRSVIFLNFIILSLTYLIITSFLYIILEHSLIDLFKAILIISLFTIIAFISSTIGKNYKRIFYIQENFYNVSAKFKIPVLLIFNLLITLPMIYVYTNLDYNKNLLILSGTIFLLLIAFLLLNIAFKYPTSKTNKRLKLYNEDYFYLKIIIVIFIITFILVFVFHPSIGKNGDVRTRTERTIERELQYSQVTVPFNKKDLTRGEMEGLGIGIKNTEKDNEGFKIKIECVGAYANKSGKEPFCIDDCVNEYCGNNPENEM